MRYNKRLVEIRAKIWNDKRKDNSSPVQCSTRFKISGFRCAGMYGHVGACQDVDYPAPSKDLSFFHE